MNYVWPSDCENLTKKTTYCPLGKEDDRWFVTRFQPSCKRNKEGVNHWPQTKTKRKKQVGWKQLWIMRDKRKPKKWTGIRAQKQQRNIGYNVTDDFWWSHIYKASSTLYIWSIYSEDCISRFYEIRKYVIISQSFLDFIIKIEELISKKKKIDGIRFVFLKWRLQIDLGVSLLMYDFPK